MLNKNAFIDQGFLLNRPSDQVMVKRNENWHLGPDIIRKNFFSAIEVQEKQNQGAKLAAMVRPSQPIDIQVGKGRSRAPEQIKCRQIPIGLAQTQKQQHQPKVIQPRRLSGSASVSLGPVYGVHGNFAEARNASAFLLGGL